MYVYMSMYICVYVYGHNSYHMKGRVDTPSGRKSRNCLEIVFVLAYKTSMTLQADYAMWHSKNSIGTRRPHSILRSSFGGLWYHSVFVWANLGQSCIGCQHHGYFWHRFCLVYCCRDSWEDFPEIHHGSFLCLIHRLCKDAEVSIIHGVDVIRDVHSVQ